MDAATDSVFDPAPLERLRAMQRPGRPSLVDRIVDLFLEDTPKKLADIRRAATSGDDELLHRSAHTLKSSAANVGALELARACEGIEKGVKAGEVEAARSAAERLPPVVERALVAVERGARAG